MKTASWIIREKESKRVVMETFDPKILDILNTKYFEAVPILEYLASLNGTTPDLPKKRKV